MSGPNPPMIGIAGYKHVGKTTLVERLVTELSARGMRVATVKHAHHNIEVDEPGRDSHRHRMAGAQEVAVVSSGRWALMAELRGAPEPTLDEIVARFSPTDIIIIEGYKTHDFPKIEIRRKGVTRQNLAGEVPNVVAVASDGMPEPGLPDLDLDDIQVIADFVSVYFELNVTA
ncbi:Molybdopterin-guanine dinucleotide biosynthesis protein MobB [hydrothermal vent metagenome]|uniref:Molybdopterin-guanine dinucleotide biosynthesis protein MobB n=1 Tax=hydrothermal vent metagenome TaxID=652676 RepID=A0A3B0T3C3_9ZZZZ